MRELFEDKKPFNDDIRDVGNVTDMKDMFCFAEAFNQDISGRNTSNGTNMYTMFRCATIFNQNISTWNVSNVTDMRRMFD